MIDAGLVFGVWYRPTTRDGRRFVTQTKPTTSPWLVTQLTSTMAKHTKIMAVRTTELRILPEILAGEDLGFNLIPAKPSHYPDNAPVYDSRGCFKRPWACRRAWAGAEGTCYHPGLDRPAYWPLNMNHPRTPIRAIAIAATIQAATANRLTLI